jgi:hypothetical protein
MKVLLSSRPTRTAIVALLMCVCMGGWLVGCDFNVEITDEKRALEKIGGTPPCASGQRFSEGKSGTQTIRIFLVDDQQNPEALDLDGIDKEPFNLKITSFNIPDTTDDDGNKTIEVIDASDGSVVSGAKVTLSLVEGNDDLLVQPNPRYSSLKTTIGNRRVPAAVNLLVDMSETSADQDSKQSRTSAPAGWVLENFNGDSTRGDLDVVSAQFVRSGGVSLSDLLFKTWETDLQYIAADGQTRGFIYTVEDSKERISRTFTNITNSSVEGDPPAYASIQAAALNARTVARDQDTDEALFNPGLIFLSLQRDHSLIDSKNANNLTDAVEAIKGKSWDSDDQADFIPMMGIVYPAPDQTSVADWDKYIDGLCNIAEAGGVSKRIYWGQLFHVPLNPRLVYQSTVRGHLDMAFHALKGYLELKVKYSLSGVEDGKRYFVKFKLQGELLQQKSNITQSPYIHFEVRTK